MSRDTAPRPGSTLVRFEDVWKSFGGRPAVAGVSLELRAGEVVGFVGPNGAGKSTLVKLLDGVYTQDRGTIRTADGSPVGDIVGVVHQELGVIDSLTVTENVRLGVSAPRRAGVFVRRIAERRAAADALARVGLDVDPTRTVGSLSAAEKSLMAVARLLTRDKKVIVVDETTAALPLHSARWLMDRLRDLAADGASVVVISHRLGEIVESCDRLVVLVDGRITLDRPVEGIDEAGIGDAMSGGKLRAARTRKTASFAAAEAEPLLRLVDVAGDAVSGVNLDLRPGEVVGISGPVGSGLHDVARIAAGVVKPGAGRRTLAARTRVAFVPPDRRKEGLLLSASIQWNASLASLHRYRRGGLLDLRRERRTVTEICERIGVKAVGIDQRIGELSGGNQQKVLLARVLLDQPQVIVLCEPTIGVDVHTRAEIYGLIDDLKAGGAAVLVASSDIEEVLTISDRLGVVRGGTLQMLDGSSARADDDLKQLVM